MLPIMMYSIKYRFVLAVALCCAALLATSGWLDRQGYDYTQAGLQRALVTFGISRTLNGVVSVAQGTEVAVEPVGIGMTFTPGQILDPVNDLVERFSTVVLVAGTAFGAQHVLLDVAASGFFRWLVFGFIGAALLVLLAWQKVAAPLRTFVVRGAITLMFVRLAVPIFAIGGELFYQQFLAPQYQQSSEQLTLTTERLNLLNEQSSGEVNSKAQDRSLFESARDWVQNAGSALDWEEHLAEFSQAAEAASEHAIRLMVVFVFQTLLLPLFSMWLLLKLGRICVSKGLGIL